MSALPKAVLADVLPIIEPKAPELSLSERLIRLGRKINAESIGSTVQADLNAAIAFFAVRDLAEQMKKAKPAFEAVRRLGTETTKRQAREMREDWTSFLTSELVDAAKQNRHLTRAQLIEAVRRYCLTRRYEGKNGEQVKRVTIKRWLSVELETDIRQLALSRIRL